MYWTTGSGCIELNITKKQAAICSHVGDCEADLKYVIANYPTIKRQLDKLDVKKLAAELNEYGCWNDDELADHEQNKVRILWIATGDIMEGKD